jgi:hypothetical protein
MIESLPFYCKKIVLSASIHDDYCYIVTPYSIIMVFLENNRITEIQTSTLAKALKDNFSEDRKKMLYPMTTGTERSVKDYTDLEMKLDGPCRLIALPGYRLHHRLLVCMGSGFTMITIRLDQAEIDIADANFEPLKLSSSEEKITPSSISYSLIEAP